MSRTRVFQDELWLPRPREEVFEFFADARNLEEITPEFLRFRIVSETPIEMREGAQIDYRLRIHGVPARWRTRIDVWEPPTRFVDTQIRGPYRQWIHEHRFEESNGGTRVVDTVRFRVPGWILEPVLYRLLVRRDVQQIFAHRKQRLEERFPRG